MVAHHFGVERNGVTALYFADTHDWEFVIGDEPLKAVGRPTEVSALADWKKSLQARAAETSEKLIALAEKRASADKPLTEPQKNYIRIAAMLEELVEEFSPKTSHELPRTSDHAFLKRPFELLISGLRAG
jgi:hypothetical protein